MVPKCFYFSLVRQVQMRGLSLKTVHFSEFDIRLSPLWTKNLIIF